MKNTEKTNMAQKVIYFLEEQKLNKKDSQKVCSKAYQTLRKLNKGV